MAACPNCARPLAPSADCGECGQERPPASDAMLTPGPAASQDRRRTLLALAPFLLLITTASLAPDLDGLGLWLVFLSTAALILWSARTEPARLRWGPVLERSARRRDLAWMVFAVALGNSVVTSTMYWCLVYWRPSDGFWSSGLGGLLIDYYFISGFFAECGVIAGLASVVWRLDVAARRRGRAPSQWLRRIAAAAFLLAVTINLALTMVMLGPSAVANALNADFFNVMEVLIEAGMIASVIIGGLCAIGGLVILSLLPAALRSPR